ncbi:EF hand [Opisthorchis viverrini]|uniref:EF hand n=1 Tax=Opisthorchis viverrini TaxID=6198 RepID=A0A1S8X1M3_OPIVI|nr:EF hand [Opisthorchis viverrini]
MQPGEKQYKFEEFLPCYEAILKEKAAGTFADYMEAFKTFDREGQGIVSAAEMRHVLTGYGEKLKEDQVDQILKFIDLREDLEGNVKYEDGVQHTPDIDVNGSKPLFPANVYYFGIIPSANQSIDCDSRGRSDKLCSSLSKAEVEDIREVFDLFDFWDGRDGMIDAVKVGDLLRCSGMNPTIAICVKHGATRKQGEKQYKFDEFLPCYEAILKENEGGTFADYMEAFKTFDREGQGFISAAEMRHVLTGYGEYLEDSDVDKIVKLIDLHEDLDGNIKYEELIKKVMQGPSAK